MLKVNCRQQWSINIYISSQRVERTHICANGIKDTHGAAVLHTKMTASSARIVCHGASRGSTHQRQRRLQSSCCILWIVVVKSAIFISHAISLPAQEQTIETQRSTYMYMYFQSYNYLQLSEAVRRVERRWWHALTP